MTKMFISLEGSADQIAAAEREFDTIRSKAAIPTYSCKMYRARLEQGAAREHAPLHQKPMRSIRSQK
jgi:hypothetical protein